MSDVRFSMVLFPGWFVQVAKGRRSETPHKVWFALYAVRGRKEEQAPPTFYPKHRDTSKAVSSALILVLWEQVTADHRPVWRRTQVTLSIYTIRDPEWHLILSSETTSREVLFLFSFYKWDWGTERLSNLTRVTEVVIGKAGVWTKVLPTPEPVLVCYFPENSLCFWNLCLSFCCTVHLKRLFLLFLPFLAATLQKSSHPPSCVSSEGFLKPPNWLGLLPPLNSKTPGAPLGLASPFHVIKPD